MYEKSYKLSKSLQAEVDAELAASKLKYASIAHIIWESSLEDIAPEAADEFERELDEFMENDCE